MCGLRLASVVTLVLTQVLHHSSVIVIGNAKYAHVGYPKNWLHENAPIRGLRSFSSTRFKIAFVETWSVLTACDRDKQAMSLTCAAGTSTIGKTLERHFTIIKSNNTWDVRSGGILAKPMTTTCAISTPSMSINQKAKDLQVSKTLGRCTSGGYARFKCSQGYRRLMLFFYGGDSRQE